MGAAEETLRVLVVEDDEDDLMLTEVLLHELPGFASVSVDWARTYAEGLARVSEPYDIVLVDFRLGSRDGIEFVTAALAAGVVAPLVLLTGQGDRDVARDALRAGAVDYLPKRGLSVDALERSIRHGIERARSASALRASEARYRLLFEAGPRPTWVYDLETLAFLAVNTAATARYGYTADEFRAMSVLDLHPRAARAAACAMARSADGAAAGRTWLHLTCEGRVRDVELSSHRLTYLGRPAALVIVEDVTERLKLEQALRQSEGHARASEVRFRTALDGMLDAFYVLRPVRDAADAVADFACEEINRAGALLLRVGMDDVIGRHLSELLPFAHVSGLLDLLRRVLATAARYEGEYEVAEACVTARWLRLQVIPTPDGLAVTARDITDKKRAEEALADLAVRDELTGLMNRRGFWPLAEHELRLARREARRDAVLYLDLNGFKPINDTYGHAEGDRVLVRIAQLLRATLREADLVARLGGDEFAVYACGLDGEEDAQAVTDRIQAAIAADNAVATAAGRPYEVRVAVGAVETAPGEGLESLLARADAALYASKPAHSRSARPGHAAPAHA